MSQQEQQAEAQTPRELAKQLIHRDVAWAVQNGLSEKAGCHYIVMSSPGRGFTMVRGHQVIIWKVDDDPCDIRFRLEELYREIASELKAEQLHVTQPSLFDSSASA